MLSGVVNFEHSKSSTVTTRLERFVFARNADRSNSHGLSVRLSVHQVRVLSSIQLQVGQSF